MDERHAARFQDLEVWQEAKKLAVSIYNLTSSKTFDHDWGLRDQMRRAAVSIMANIAEGFGRNSRKEFSRYLIIALGSNSELQSHLHLAFEVQYCTTEQFNHQIQLAECVAKQLAGFIKYLKLNLN